MTHVQVSQNFSISQLPPKFYCGDITLLAGVGSRASDTIFHHLQRCLLESSGGDPDASPRPRVGESVLTIPVTDTKN